MNNDYPSDWDSRRKKVYKRDDYKCQNCGALGGSRGNEELHAHHGVPISKGGSHNLGNLTTYCKECHYVIHTDDATVSKNASDNSTTLDSIKCPNCGGPRLETRGHSIDSLINVECSSCDALFKTTRDWNSNGNNWVLVKGQDELQGLKLPREGWKSLNQLRINLSPLEKEVHEFSKLHLHGEIVDKDLNLDFEEMVKDATIDIDGTILSPENEIWEDYLEINTVNDTTSEIESALRKLRKKGLIVRSDLPKDEYRNSEDYRKIIVYDVPTKDTIFEYANEIGEKVRVNNRKISGQKVDPVFKILSWMFAVFLLTIFVGMLFI